MQYLRIGQVAELDRGLLGARGERRAGSAWR
jgi:hypothetical protein